MRVAFWRAVYYTLSGIATFFYRGADWAFGKLWHAKHTAQGKSEEAK